VDSTGPEDHAAAILSGIELRFEEALALTAKVGPESFANFARHLDPALIEEILLATGTATLRRRRLPAERVVWLVIGMALIRDRPIAEVVRQLDLALPAADGTHGVAPSAIVQARARVGSDPLHMLFLRTSPEWALRSAKADPWRGLSLFGVDGTTLRAPDSDENRAHFGSQKSGKRGETGYPQVRMVPLMALRSHLIVDASFGPYGVDERRYAERLWSSVPDDSLVLIDRGYLQANVLVPLNQGGSNRHWMTRAKSNSKWIKLKALGKGDDLIEMTVSGEARRKDPSLPKTFHARAIRYQRKGYRPSTLLTSLVDPKLYPAEELRVLYHERWEIELGFGEVKTEMLQRLETIRSKSPGAVEQELWGLLIAYNLVRLEMERIADEIGVSPLRISFIAALRYIVDEWGWSTITTSPGAIPKHLDDMRDKIRRFLLPPRRPERVYPRAVKIKMSNYARKRPSSTRKRAK
jgi:Insertion element 4 transposase N-terminal/Transposase DDE domain